MVQIHTPVGGGVFDLAQLRCRHVAYKFARESNTWRRMKPYQAWVAAGAAAALVIAGLFVLY